LHLAIDGYGAEVEKLTDAELIRNFLDEYPASIGMTKILPPQVHLYRGNVPEDWGISGFVLIAESHISIHTFPERKYLNIDIFSCKDFDSDLATKRVNKYFSIRDFKIWEMDRGIEYSTPGEAYDNMVKDRVNILNPSNETYE
tara:strand:+ start:470 stop:898 length:429 start_codon:yes stop_codon:yes gene_type:complete